MAWCVKKNTSSSVFQPRWKFSFRSYRYNVRLFTYGYGHSVRKVTGSRLGRGTIVGGGFHPASNKVLSTNYYYYYYYYYAILYDKLSEFPSYAILDYSPFQIVWFLWGFLRSHYPLIMFPNRTADVGDNNVLKFIVKNGLFYINKNITICQHRRMIQVLIAQ